MRLNELFGTRMNESAVPEKSSEEVWDENKDAAKFYISKLVFFVKPLQGGAKFEVSVDDGSKRKPFTELSKIELQNDFEQVRETDKPDAEGYTQYRKKEIIEALKYEGETVLVNSVLLEKGDYLLRTVYKNTFKYEVKGEQDFEKAYVER